MKLNLGCGFNKLDGWVNVDKYAACSPDAVADLEETPWRLFKEDGFGEVLMPLHDSSVSEIMLNHVLEHLGQSPDVFRGIVQEIYRVLQPGGIVHINVPHPFHLNFVSDPTHVRPITPELLSLLSKKNCRQFIEMKAANSPLAIYWDVDFDVVEAQQALDAAYAQWQNNPAAPEMARSRTNFIAEYRMKLVSNKGKD